MAADGYITIHRTTDVAQGELLAEMLRREGIDARFHHVSSTLIGMPASMIEMTLDVPVEAEARAKEVMRDLEYAAAADAIETGDEEGPAPPHAFRWRALARAGFTLFLPGTVHLYAGRPWTALVLFVGAAVGVCVAFGLDDSMSSGIAIATVVAIVCCDMVDGVRAANAETHGHHLARRRQVVNGFMLVALVAAVGLAARTAVAVPGWWRAHVLRRFAITCTKGGVMIRSQDADNRALSFHRVAIATASPAGGQAIYDVTLPTGPMLRLAPGTTGRLPFTPEPELAARCAAGDACAVVFDVTIDAAEGGPLPLEVAGECTPGWGESSDAVPGRLTLTGSDGE
jgi:hypothetical protein